MSVNTNELLALPAEEKIRIIEMLWDNLGESAEPIPIPDWAVREAIRRRDEMIADPSLGSSHEEVWKRIESRKGRGD